MKDNHIHTDIHTYIHSYTHTHHKGDDGELPVLGHQALVDNGAEAHGGDPVCVCVCVCVCLFVKK
jgi:hypothetical protein